MISLVTRSSLSVPYKVRWFMCALRANHSIIRVYRVDYDWLPHAYWIVLSLSPISSLVLTVSSALQVPIFPYKPFDTIDELYDYIRDLVIKLPVHLHQ